MISVAVIAKVRYSYSVLERGTVRCLQDDKEIRLGPRKTQNPLVDYVSSRQSAQSVLENA